MNILLTFYLVLVLAFLPLAPSGIFAQTFPKTNGYFQQRVDHAIQVRLDDQQHVLRGRTRMLYHHNGTRPLDTLYFHLWPNAFSGCKSHWCKQQIENGSTKFLDAPKAQRGAIDSLSFVVNGQAVAHNPWQNMPDVAFVVLPTPLQPGQKLTIETPFRVKIPASFSRLGHVRQQYQLTQWYPKPAVYDANGWHPMPYLDQGEFYSEFGTFDVTIQLPRNYVVGATGVLQDNPEERRFLAQREQISRAILVGDSSVAKKGDKSTGSTQPFRYPYLDTEYKTLRFVQDSVHDFAWFCDKDYYVLTDSVQLPQSRRWVKTVALFNHKDRRFWEKAPQYINQAVWSYSNHLGDYPYSHCTAVDGALSAGAGMEYPMITVVGSGGSADALRRVIIHEVGHNWFYGILATNERNYPWLDEGFNSYLEYRTVDSLNTLTSIGKKPSITAAFLGLNLDFLGINDSDDMICLAQNYVQGNGRVEPLEYPAAKYWSTNYGVIVYIKSVAALRMLENYLTRPRFDAALRNYYERWKFRHPQPEDVRQAFEQSSGQDLSWFFNRYVHTRQTPDFQVLNVQEKDSSRLMVRVRQVGNDTLPVCIQVVGRAGDTLATTWTQPFSGVLEQTIQLPPGSAWQRVDVNPGPLIPEQLTGNNVWYRRAVFSRTEPLKLNLVGVNTPMHKRMLSVLPAVAFNQADRVAAGFLAYYQFFPKKKFEAHVMPMYSVGLRTLAGSTGFKYRFLNRSTGFLRRVEWQNHAASFGGLARARTGVSFQFLPHNLRSGISHQLSVRAHWLADVGQTTDTYGSYAPRQEGLRPLYIQTQWRTERRHVRLPVELMGEVGLEPNHSLVRLMADARLGWRVSKSWNLDARLFAGTLWNPNPASLALIPQGIQLGVTGSHDLLGERYVFDRNASGRQVFLDHGAVRFNNYLLRSDQVIALNLTLKTPVPLFRFYLDVEASTGYVAGVNLPVIRRVLELHVPLLGYFNSRSWVPDSIQTLADGLCFTLDVSPLIRQLNL